MPTLIAGTLHVLAALLILINAPAALAMSPNVQPKLYSMRISRNLSGSAESFNIAFYVIICALLLICIVYNICIKRKIDQDSYHETYVETMLRQDVIASDEEMNTLWECEICCFKSYAAHKSCMLCGTDQAFRLVTKGSVCAKDVVSEDMKKETVNNAKPRWVTTDFRENIKRLNMRQRSARSRHDWTREKNEDGNFVWRRKKHLLDRKTLENLNRIGSGARDSGCSNISGNSISIVSQTMQSPGDSFIRLDIRPAENSIAPIDTDFIEAYTQLSTLPFQQKHAWFVQHIAAMSIPWEQGHLLLQIERENILHNSSEKLLTATWEQLHQCLRIQFTNEPGVDAGGLVREWFTLMTKDIFDESTGLFYLTGNRDAWMINTASDEASVDHLMYYEAIGRFIGRAIFEGILVEARFALPIYKHILGIPITLSDVEFIDSELYRNLTWLRHNSGIEALCLNFSITCEHSQLKSKVIELKPNGANIAVTDQNKEEYIELRFKWIVAYGISRQLAALVQGIYAIIPSQYLSIFDHQELELLVCGLSEIDIVDWKSHTVYVGTKHEPTISWFWEILELFSSSQRSRLLQFTTGSPRAPVQGFKALTMNDGKICCFSIQCISADECSYPRAHTCFNRIDLPIYERMEDLQLALTLILEADITGFTIE